MTSGASRNEPILKERSSELNQADTKVDENLNLFAGTVKPEVSKTHRKRQKIKRKPIEPRIEGDHDTTIAPKLMRATFLA